MAGWDDLEDPVPIESPGGLDINILIVRTFGTEEGQKVLAWMREFYLERPVWEPGAEPSIGYWKSGQQSVIRDIESRIKKGTHERHQ